MSCNRAGNCMSGYVEPITYHIWKINFWMQVVLCSYVGWFGGRKGHMFASKASKRRIGPQIKYPLKKNSSYFLSNFSLKVMTTMTPFIRLTIWIDLATVYYAGLAPLDFGRSVDHISTKGDRLFPSNNTGTPGFFRPTDGPAM